MKTKTNQSTSKCNQPQARKERDAVNGFQPMYGKALQTRPPRVNIPWSPDYTFTTQPTYTGLLPPTPAPAPNSKHVSVTHALPASRIKNTC